MKARPARLIVHQDAPWVMPAFGDIGPSMKPSKEHPCLWPADRPIPKGWEEIVVVEPGLKVKVEPVACPSCGHEGPFEDYRIATVPAKDERTCPKCRFTGHPSVFRRVQERARGHGAVDPPKLTEGLELCSCGHDRRSHVQHGNRCLVRRDAVNCACLRFEGA